MIFGFGNRVCPRRQGASGTPCSSPLTVCVQIRRKEEVIAGEPGGAPGSTPKCTLFPPELPHAQQWSPAPRGTGHAVLSFLLRYTTLNLLLLRKGCRAHLSLLISPHLKLGLHPSFMLLCVISTQEEMSQEVSLQVLLKQAT